MKKAIGILLISGLTYCSVADHDSEEKLPPPNDSIAAAAPCDSIETTWYDQNGKSYQAKMPCDTTKLPKGDPADTVRSLKK